MKLERFHHAQITIPPDAEAEARAFYCGLLGLPEIEKPDSLKQRGGFWLELGDVQIHVGTEDGVTRPATKAHLAYEVDDVRAWRARLREAVRNRLDAEGRWLITSERTRDQSLNLEDARRKALRVLEAALERPIVRQATQPTRGSQARRLEAKRATSARKQARRGGWD